MTAPTVFTLTITSIRSTRATVTLITGGINGIGLQTALLLHDLNEGNRIIILDQSNKSKCKAPEEFLTSSRVHFEECNVTNWESLRAGFDAGIKRYGAIDNVFVNAGINEHADQIFHDILGDDQQLKEPDHRTLHVDLDAAIATVKLAIYHIRHRKDGRVGGSIVMTASLAGYLASAGAPLYSAAKHGLVGLMRSLKNDTAKLGIAISVVAPGITLTELVAGRKPDESLADWATRMRVAGVPINTPEEVAMAVTFLMSLEMKANGKGLLIQAGKIADVEEGIARNRSSWMSPEMLELFKGGRNAPLFPNKL